MKFEIKKTSINKVFGEFSIFLTQFILMLKKRRQIESK